MVGAPDGLDRRSDPARMAWPTLRRVSGRPAEQDRFFLAAPSIGLTTTTTTGRTEDE
jgi:hypothetical protein